MKVLYGGFDLCDPATSVSMTINGPAPSILAMFMNTAIDQQVEKHLRETGQWEAGQQRIDDWFKSNGKTRPTYRGELLKWLLLENVPGSFPYAAGVFAFKRENEDPTRMFAGEGDAFRTNTRFKLLSEGMPAKRLSTAFDSVSCRMRA